MNKKLFLSALASTALLASCVENDLGSNENISGNGNGDGRIGFNYKVGNMTRATELAQNAGHYEFGVYAFKGATPGNTTDPVMENYLVAYGNTTNLYQDLKNQASTWGSNAGGNYTDVENKVSSWFYEGIGISGTSGDGLTWGNTGYTVPDANQVLKYWDKNQAVHDFYAFMPYSVVNMAATPDPTINKVTYASNALTFTGINAFATSTAQKLQLTSPYQVTGARFNENSTVSQKVIPVSSGTSEIEDFNKEVLNYNEGLYAYTSVEKANYDKDVELTFKHINAKVNVAFYEDIKGYKVELIDLVPVNTDAPGSGYLPVAAGVQFSPATLLQAEEPMATGHAQPTALPTYNSAATIVVSNMNTTPAIAHTAGTEITKNLVFEATNNSAASVPGSGASRQFIGESRAAKTMSTTTLYPLGIYDGTTSKYITQENSQTFQTSSDITTTTASTNVGDATGYTLHVSYKMIPMDGSSDIIIYDARVHVAAEYCRWEPGKAYTYIFKITDRANGVTDPKTVDPSAGGTTPWIDPTDPRVPDDPILSPIVFDGVTVTNYEDANTGKKNDVDEWVISDPDSWTFATMSSTKYYYDNSGVYGKNAVEDITKRFDLAAATSGLITKVIPAADGRSFTVTIENGATDIDVVYKANTTHATATSSIPYTRVSAGSGAYFDITALTEPVVADLFKAQTGGPMPIKPSALSFWTGYGATDAAKTGLEFYNAVEKVVVTATDVKYKYITDVCGEIGTITSTKPGTGTVNVDYTVSATFNYEVVYATGDIIARNSNITGVKSAYLIVTKK